MSFSRSAASEPSPTLVLQPPFLRLGGFFVDVIWELRCIVRVQLARKMLGPIELTAVIQAGIQ